MRRYLSKTKNMIRNYLGNLQVKNTDFRPYVWVASLHDLPTPIEGVIYLEAGYNYFILGNVDLSGNRLETLGDIAFQGYSSETSFITSTGLGVGIPLLTSAYTVSIQNLAIHDVDTCMLIDGVNVALDWQNFNLWNIPNIGTIGATQNLVCSYLAFFDCANWCFSGTIGTVSFNNSLFNNFTNAPTFDFLATAAITRRLRFVDCAFNTSGTGNSIHLNAATTVPIDQFILRGNNFAGGTLAHVVGRLATDNVSDWLINKGIDNSQNFAAIFMDDNVTVTNTGTPNTFVKVLGTTTLLTAQRFTAANNRLTYTGAIQRPFDLMAIVSLTGGNNIQFSIQIRVFNAANTLILSSVSFRVTTSGGGGIGNADNVCAKLLTPLNDGDYFELWISSPSNNQNVTIRDLFLSAQPT